MKKVFLRPRGTAGGGKGGVLRAAAAIMLLCLVVESLASPFTGSLLKYESLDALITASSPLQYVFSFASLPVKVMNRLAGGEQPPVPSKKRAAPPQRDRHSAGQFDSAFFRLQNNAAGGAVRAAPSVCLPAAESAGIGNSLSPPGPPALRSDVLIAGPRGYSRAQERCAFLARGSIEDAAGRTVLCVYIRPGSRHAGFFICGDA